MIGRIYQVLQHLSIDIALGAVVLLHFFSKPFQVDLDWSMYLLLASSIWVIYTVDHLRDAKLGKDGSRARYAYHRKHSKPLKITLVIVVLLSATLTVRLPLSVIVGGSILVFFSILYALLQSRLAKWGAKEAYVACIYTCGVLVAPVALTQTLDPFLFVILFILAFTNLILFSWYEFAADREDGFRSIATTLGTSRLEKLIMIVIAFGLACAISGIFSRPWHALYGFIALGIYSGLLIYNQHPKALKYYRVIGDGVFILPIILEWL